MTIQRMEHVGIVVDDLAAATGFFVELGLESRFSTDGRAGGRADARRCSRDKFRVRPDIGHERRVNAMLAPNVRGPSLFVTNAR
jgi:catechol 2,3-dioxygenase-like lactoylglutathione lyase family enzyme